jgi:hypothetical protein
MGRWIDNSNDRSCIGNERKRETMDASLNIRMRFPTRPIPELDRFSPIVRDLGLVYLSTEGCALPAVDGSRAHYYRLDVLAELLERFASDEAKAALIHTCNAAPMRLATWWFRPREEAKAALEETTRTRLALQE